MKKTLNFGKYQLYMSDRMRKNPFLAKMISMTFGYTVIGAYGRQIIFRKLLKRIPMNGVTRILDLGCGQGEFSFMLAENYPDGEITAMDINGGAIDRISETANHFGLNNIKCLNGKIDQFPTDNYFDLIFAVDVFEHILEPEMPFAGCFRKLKSGGYLIIKMPARDQKTIAPESWFADYNEHRKREHIGQVYELDDLVNRFKKENFKIVSAFYSDGMLARAGWELNYFLRKGGTVPELLSLPFSKTMMKLDRMAFSNRKGNYIQVIGQKP